MKPNNSLANCRAGMATLSRAALVLGLSAIHAVALPQFDFTQAGSAARWQASHHVAPLEASSDGLVITIIGGDPFIEGPAVNFASPNPIHLRARLKSEAGGYAQLFWFTNSTSENRSVWFAVNTNSWTDVCVPLPSLGEGWRLRFDPPGTNGSCVVAWMKVEEANATGITRLAAGPGELAFTLTGLSGEVEIAELAPYQTLSDAPGGPVVHRGTFSGRGQFSIPRFATNGAALRDRLYSTFVPLQAHARFGRIPVGPARFVEEISGVSKYNTPFPTAKSKKGLQIQIPDDALKLGVQHAAMNLNLTGLVDLSRNPANLAWQMDGETYYFNRHYVESLPVKQFSDAGCVVTLILLTYRSGNPALDAVMLHPQRAAALPNGLAGFNTSTPDGLRHFKACLEFLADRFSRPDVAFGRVANYVIGNEVTAHWEWYNLGLMPREPAVAEYERSVRLAQTAVRKFSSSARVYLSLEHHWTLIFSGDPRKAVAGRSFVEEFNRRAQLGGNYDWHLAYHPYPENLFQPRTWLDKSALASPDSPRITFKNLEQLTIFFRRPELLFRGQPRRIILSEQGFHSDNTPAGDAAQAAAYCYAWQKVTRLDAIDSFILHRHVDHSGEGGLNLGLWRRQTNSVATPSTPRPMYEVFRQADTPDWEAAFRFALPVIGIKNWEEIFQAR
jgi:hypothetical protein